MSNKMYDLAKYTTQIVLPATAGLYAALAGIWGLPNPDAVVGTLTALVTFLSTLLGISSAKYSAGRIKK